MNRLTIGFLTAVMLLTAAGSAAAQRVEDAVERTRLAQACGNELKLSEAGCRCLVDRAVLELNDLQRDYLLATAIAPRAAERMRANVSQQDIQLLAKFLAEAEQECSAK